ncbi:hypothetical protein GCM10010232_65160 [Streptomyces amakusaensis]
MCPTHENTPGPLTPDLSGGTLTFRATGDPAETAAGLRRLAVVRDVRDVLADIVEQWSAEDPSLHYLDGRDLYGQSDHDEFPLPGAIHPAGAGLCPAQSLPRPADLFLERCEVCGLRDTGVDDPLGEGTDFAVGHRRGLRAYVREEYRAWRALEDR